MDDHATSQVVELTEDESRDLLQTDQVGRVAFVTPTGPRIVPVNYAVAGDAVEFRTTAYSELAVHAPDQPVAFEIDHLDHQRERGWSVVVQGTCRRVDHASGTREADDGPEPWAGGVRPLVLRVEMEQVTGRRVGGEHWPHPVVSGRGRSY